MAFNKLVESLVEATGRGDGRIRLTEEGIMTLLSAQNALKFYADERNYESAIYDEFGQHNSSEVDADGGAIARMAVEWELGGES